MLPFVRHAHRDNPSFPLEGSESGQEGTSPLTPSSLVGYEVRGLPSRDS